MYKRKDGLYEKIITVNGKRIPFRGKSESIVNRKILNYRGEVEKGRLFKDVAEEWKDEHFPTLAYNSTKNYKPAYERAVEHFKDKYIKEIKASDVNSFIVKFAKQGYSHKTVSIQLLVLNLIFSKACIDNELEFNPATYVKVPKNLSKTKREMPTKEDIEIIKKSINCTFGLFAYFILHTGCRKGEALALQFKDIDYDSKMIKVYKSTYYVGNKAEIKKPKTQAGIRDIILMDRLAEKLPKGKNNDFIFNKGNGEPMTAKGFIVAWKKYCEETGLNLTPHQLRHAYATILFEAGIDEKDAQELLGHSSIAVTRDIYTHISKARKQKTAELLNKFDG